MELGSLAASSDPAARELRDGDAAQRWRSLEPPPGALLYHIIYYLVYIMSSRGNRQVAPGTEYVIQCALYE